MRYFERMNLRRGRAQASSGGKDHEPKSECENRPPPAQVNAAESAAEDDRKKGDKGWRRFEIISGIAIGLTIIWLTYLQWGTQDRQANISDAQLDLGNRQYDFTENEAADDARDEATTREIQQSQADAMMNMAQAAQKQSLAAERQVEAANRQAAALQGQLKASLTGWVSVSPPTELEGYDFGKVPQGWLVIDNVGHVPVRIVVRYAQDMPAFSTNPPRATSFITTKPTTIPVSRGRKILIGWRELDAREFYLLITGKEMLRVSGEVLITDATGKTRSEPFCAVWYGRPGNMTLC